MIFIHETFNFKIEKKMRKNSFPRNFGVDCLGARPGSIYHRVISNFCTKPPLFRWCGLIPIRQTNQQCFWWKIKKNRLREWNMFGGNQKRFDRPEMQKPINSTFYLSTEGKARPSTIMSHPSKKTPGINPNKKWNHI